MVAYETFPKSSGTCQQSYDTFLRPTNTFPDHLTHSQDNLTTFWDHLIPSQYHLTPFQTIWHLPETIWYLAKDNKTHSHSQFQRPYDTFSRLSKSYSRPFATFTRVLTSSKNCLSMTTQVLVIQLVDFVYIFLTHFLWQLKLGNIWMDFTEQNFYELQLLLSSLFMSIIVFGWAWEMGNLDQINHLMYFFVYRYVNIKNKNIMKEKCYSTIFTELATLGWFSHRVAMSVCVSVCLSVCAIECSFS